MWRLCLRTLASFLEPSLCYASGLDPTPRYPLMTKTLTVFGSLALLSLAACGDDPASIDGQTDTGVQPDATGADSGDDAAGTEGVTYHEHVRPIVEQHCVSCHAVGGIGPFDLSDPENAIQFGAAIAASALAGDMPPWMPDDECLPISHVRRLEAAELDVIEGWRTGGYEAGDAARFVPPTEQGTPTLEDPTIVTQGEPYAPNATLGDDYRCLPMDHVFEDDVWLTGTHVDPDQDAIVHHVLLFLVTPEQVEAMNQLDASEDGPGYTCFGDTRLGDDKLMSAWAPGSVPVLMPTDTALRIPAGSRLIAQVHYSMTSVTDVETVPDESQIQLWTTTDAPDYEVRLLQVLDSSFTIPAGDADYSTERTFPVPVNGEIIGLLPHMHMLGKSITMSHAPAGGESSCLVNIPEWDFNWQQMYSFPESEFVPVRFGDEFTIRCEWDNSAENQPTVDGQQIAPRDVRWGEGSLDEMCYGIIVARSPRVDDEGGLCGGFEACYDGCDDDDGACLLACGFEPGEACLDCVFDNLEPCMLDNCGTETVTVFTCLNACEGEDLDCLVDECATELDALSACIAPHIRSGACDDGLSVCDVSFGD
ncbi:MAG: hypothetical protein ACI81R_001514 [Bradymonadia bacterium]|jgi:hypothetical protein